MLIGSLLVSVFLLSFFLTVAIRRYALSHALMDIPNYRSSHHIPTPRGGGLAFVISFLVAIPGIIYAGFTVFPIGFALMGSAIIAMVGLIDDYRTLPHKSRMLVHLGVSIAVLAIIGGMPSIDIAGFYVPKGVFLNCMAVVYLVWLLNLYNFMDGINGLAGIEVITVCMSMVFLYTLQGMTSFIGLPLVLSAAVLGFVGWNFPYARIFMGDVGSGFLGIVLGLLSLQAAAVAPPFFWAYLVLLGMFIVDATVTILCRLCLGKNITKAHCSHAYQKAAALYKSHIYITLTVLLLNLGWLLPIALLVTKKYLYGLTGLLIAYFPLIILALLFQAGRDDKV